MKTIAIGIFLGTIMGATVVRLQTRHKPCEYFKASDVSMMFVPARCVVK